MFACVRNVDVEGNGILKMIRLIALKVSNKQHAMTQLLMQVREPGLMYGQHQMMPNGTMDWSAKRVHAPFCGQGGRC